MNGKIITAESFASGEDVLLIPVVATCINPNKPDPAMAVALRRAFPEPDQPPETERIKLPVRAEQAYGSDFRIVSADGVRVCWGMTKTEADQIADGLNVEPWLRELVEWAVYCSDMTMLDNRRRLRKILSRLPESWRAGR